MKAKSSSSAQMVWYALAVIAGGLTYFSLRIEPPFAKIAMGTVLICIFGVGLTRQRFFAVAPPLHVLSSAFMLFCIGFTNAQLHTCWQPMQPALPWYGTVLEGKVSSIDHYPNRRGEQGSSMGMISSVVLKNTRFLSGVERDTQILPRSLKLRLRNAADATGIRPGDTVSFRAMLHYIPPPSFPGGADGEFQAWFSGLGGVGYALSDVEKVTPSTRWKWREEIEEWRKALAGRIIRVMNVEEGAVAATVLTGITFYLPDTLRQHYATAGLAHLLAVAGLHLGIVMGIVGLLVRKILVRSTFVALHWPLKQIALLVAAATGGVYAVMTGLHVPVMRSYLMVLWVVLALLAHRPVMSAHRFGWAIMILMLLWPELVRDLSFQMSFMAVMGLVFGYIALTPLMSYVQHVGERHFGIGGRKWGAEAFSLVLASVLAGSATLPVTMAYFGTLQPYFVAANLIAVPLMGMWIVPWGMLALLCMPFHLEWFPLQAMGYGIKIVNSLADAVALWPGATIAIPFMSQTMLYVAMAGVIVLCLLKRWWRLIGVGMIAVVMGVVFAQSAPTLLVSADTRLIGLVEHHKLVVVAGHNLYNEQKWKQAWWLEAGQQDDVPALACESDQCLWSGDQGLPVFFYFPKKYEETALRKAAHEWCGHVSLVVSTVRFYCPVTTNMVPLIIDRTVTGKQGSVAVWFVKNSPVIRTDKMVRGSRPWVREPAQHGRPNLPLAVSE